MDFEASFGVKNTCPYESLNGFIGQEFPKMNFSNNIQPIILKHIKINFPQFIKKQPQSAKISDNPDIEVLKCMYTKYKKDRKS